MSLAAARAIAAHGGWSARAVADAFVAWLQGEPRRRRHDLPGRHPPLPPGGDAPGAARASGTPATAPPCGCCRWPSSPWATTPGSARLAVEQARHHPPPPALRRRLRAGGPARPARRAWGARMRQLRACADARRPRPSRASAFEPYRGQASGYVVDTMQTVLEALFATRSFEDCLVAGGQPGRRRRHHRGHRRGHRRRLLRPGGAAGALAASGSIAASWRSSAAVAGPAGRAGPVAAAAGPGAPPHPACAASGAVRWAEPGPRPDPAGRVAATSAYRDARRLRPPGGRHVRTPSRSPAARLTSWARSSSPPVAGCGAASSRRSGAEPRRPAALQARSASLFLHHSTGAVVWAGGVPEAIQAWNGAHGTDYRITERTYPDTGGRLPVGQRSVRLLEPLGGPPGRQPRPGRAQPGRPGRLGRRHRLQALLPGERRGARRRGRPAPARRPGPSPTTSSSTRRSRPACASSPRPASSSGPARPCARRRPTRPRRSGRGPSPPG